MQSTIVRWLPSMALALCIIMQLGTHVSAQHTEHKLFRDIPDPRDALPAPNVRPKQPDHDLYHEEFYNSWSRNGKPCCDETDCAPAEAKFDPRTGQWMARRRFDPDWIMIPLEIYNEANPDRQKPFNDIAHLCAPMPSEQPEVNDLVYCFAPPRFQTMLFSPLRKSS